MCLVLVLCATSLVNVLGGRGMVVAMIFLLLIRSRSCSMRNNAPDRVEVVLMLVLLVACGALLRCAYTPVRFDGDRRLVTLIATRVGREQAGLRLSLFPTM